MTAIVGTPLISSTTDSRSLLRRLRAAWGNEDGSTVVSSFFGRLCLLAAGTCSAVALSPLLGVAHDTAAMQTLSDVQVAQESHWLMSVGEDAPAYVSAETLVEDGFVKQGVTGIATGPVAHPRDFAGDATYWVLSASDSGTVYLQLGDQAGDPLELHEGDVVPDLAPMTGAQEEELTALAQQLREEAAVDTSPLAARLQELRDAGEAVTEEVQKVATNAGQ
ncbi:hypothetical protein [Brachybacterium subflavum]|uniref:hypothetical protein n=1 Tax=Brachybacterium subflavum TaxID=2585206 RepID=UPI0018793AC9|nr:hypothetical protein [Brachybacterium subflavum]